MADEQPIKKLIGKNLRFLLQVQQQWDEETELAIDKVKKSVNRSELRDWFKQMWKKELAKNRRKKQETDRG